VLKDTGKDITQSPVSPEALAELLHLVDDRTLSGKMGKSVFQKMVKSGKSAKQIVAAEGLEQVTDTAAIGKLCREVLERNPDKVEQYKKGKTALFGFFVGQVMKASRGRANPQQVNAALKQFLGD
jgi:aspartyl-tRNA(Asn)/glutamyl-tRNA(Gln) amidotransferase subunit B